MNGHHETLADLLDRLTAPAQLYQTLPDKAVRCLACAHRCLIRDGRRGICQVRFNLDGVLYAPHGYAAGIQSDPIEKKPFYHVLPGSDALTFGMLGCDMHCDYCFPGDTMVMSELGPIPLEQIFHCGHFHDQTDDGEISYPQGLRVFTGSGRTHPVRAAFRHPYQGLLTTIQVADLPPLRCTPDHRVYATEDISQPPRAMPARSLTTAHWLAIPRPYPSSQSESVGRVAVRTAGHEARSTMNVLQRTGSEAETIYRESSKVLTGFANMGSQEPGSEFVRTPAIYRPGILEFVVGTFPENGTLPWHTSEVSHMIEQTPITPALAWLLGIYCACGQVRRQSPLDTDLVLVFAIARDDDRLTERVKAILNVHLACPKGSLTVASNSHVEVTHLPVIALFQSLVGTDLARRRLPQFLYRGERRLGQSFLQGTGDSSGADSDCEEGTVVVAGERLAYSIALLALKLGYRPSLVQMGEGSASAGSLGCSEAAPPEFTVSWYREGSTYAQHAGTERNYLVPVQAIDHQHYEGPVYNLEVDEEHHFLANFLLVANCQNWLTSQTLRDASAGTAPQRVGADYLVKLAMQNRAKVVVSSYNEPLITSEWAMDVFQRARRQDLICGYVSNGNATREVLEYLRPVTDCYKIDLKTMQDKNYRSLGAVLANILEGITMVHEMGFWLEIVTLVVPGFNDSPDELRDMAAFIASLSRDIPWHVTAFHTDYKRRDGRNTLARDLLRAAQIGKEVGLNYVYAGNLPGQVGEFAHTWCPGCGEQLVERSGYHIRHYALTAAGACRRCGTHIPGLWYKESPPPLHAWTSLFRGPRPL